MTPPIRITTLRIIGSLILNLIFLSAFTQNDTLNAPLFDGLGDQHHKITTDSDRARKYFDQGLILAYGFNHAEAHRSFMKVVEIDPDCAMGYWGAAWVLGPNINSAMDPANAPEAWKLLQEAIRYSDKASENEQAYIRALEKRYGEKSLDDRSSRDRAFANAMAEVAASYPDDLDAQVIYAESLMNTTPWDYWEKDGTAKAVTDTILKTLQEVLNKDANHPMANHLFIHSVEAQRPELGLEEARRLHDLVPGAGHLVHMPSHIYIRTGQYHEASKANQRAIEADRNYLEQVEAQGAYKLAYVPHNYHFLWSTSSLEGRSELAIKSAERMASIVDTGMMRTKGLTTLQHYWITPLYAHVRFGKWEEILKWEEPAEDLIYPRAVRNYARGMAYTRKGDYDNADRELQVLEILMDDPSLKWVTVWDINKSRHILDIAYHALKGELEHAKGNSEEAVRILKQAAKLEDDLNYDEPPTWHYPVRQSLAAVLTEAGKYDEAIQVYKEDLSKFPENGWSLFGLLQALRMKGEMEKAERVEEQFREAWMFADVVLTSSRY